MRTIHTLLSATITILLFHPTPGQSQFVSQGWVQQTGPSGLTYNAPAMVSDAAGNIYVVGTINPHSPQANFITVKYNSSGVVQWAATYNSTLNNDDEATAIALDPAGNVYVTGISNYPSTGIYSVSPMISTVKYSPTGVQQWATLTHVGQILNQPNAMTTDAAGNVYIAGTIIDTAAFDYDYLVVKINTNGAQQWIATYNGTANLVDIANAIAVDAGGNIYVTGYSTGQFIRNLGRFGSITINTNYDVVTIKYNAAGQVLWNNRFNGAGNSNDIATAIALDASGNVYVTGSSAPVSPNTGNSVETTIAYNNAGTQLWVDQSTNSQNNTAIAIDPSGNIMTAGYAVAGGTINYLVTKYTPAGSVTWSQGYFASTDVEFGEPLSVAMALDNQGNAYIAGRAMTPGQTQETGYNYATVKFSPAGAQDWALIYNGPDGAGDIPTGIAIYQPKPVIAGQAPPPADIYVTGIADLANNSYYGDLTTIEYTQSNFIVFRGLATQSDSLSDTDPNTLFTASLNNYPNPCRGMTNITYTLPSDSHVTLQVFNAAGQPVATLLDDNEPAGPHSLPFGSAHLAAGFYEYRIIATSPQGNFTATKKMIIE